MRTYPSKACAEDAYLRRHGFKIKCRPSERPAEAIWVRGGEFYGQSAALAECRREDEAAREVGGEG